MGVYTGIVQQLIDEFGLLPGVGPKSAQRMAYYILRIPADDANKLAHTISEVKERIGFCGICFNIAEGDKCEICRDPDRDPAVICVVEEPKDIPPIDKTGEFRGRYHVLGGAITPIEGIGPDQLKIKELVARVESEGIKEVILGTNPNTAGETTAMYIARLLKPLEITVSRPASGLPVGGDLEYADEVTLGRALAGRRELDV